MMNILKAEISENKTLPLSVKLMRIEAVSKGYIEVLLSNSKAEIEEIPEYNSIRAVYTPCYKPISNSVDFSKLMQNGL